MAIPALKISSLTGLCLGLATFIPSGVIFPGLFYCLMLLIGLYRALWPSRATLIITAYLNPHRSLISQQVNSDPFLGASACFRPLLRFLLLSKSLLFFLREREPELQHSLGHCQPAPLEFFWCRIGVSHLAEPLRKLNQYFQAFIDLNVIMLPALLFVYVRLLTSHWLDTLLLTVKHLFIRFSTDPVCTIVNVPRQVVEDVTDDFWDLVHEVKL